MSQLDKLCSPPKIRRVPSSAIIPISAKSRIKKNLFGPVDHECLSKELDARLKEINDKKKNAWGFDFEKGEPIENSSVEWTTIENEVEQKEITVEDKVEPLQFNTKAFSKIDGFKALPNANSTPENIPTTLEYINSVLKPPTLKERAGCSTPSSSQKKRLLNRTSAKVRCKRRLYPTPTSADKTQPSIQSYYKKRKHALEPIPKKQEEKNSSQPKKQKTETDLRTVR